MSTTTQLSPLAGPTYLAHRHRLARAPSDRSAREAPGAERPLAARPAVAPPVGRPVARRGSAQRAGRLSPVCKPARSALTGVRTGHPPKGDTPLTTVAHELKASYAFVERNFFLTRRYWGWELAFLVYSVAGALSISLIGAAARASPPAPHPHDRRHLLELPVGGVLAGSPRRSRVERWEGTLEYTFMAPVRRWTQLLGSCVYAMVYGLVHTAVILVVLILFFPQLDLSQCELGDRRRVHAARLVQLRRASG